jgi:hypothetical protein
MGVAIWKELVLVTVDGDTRNVVCEVPLFGREGGIMVAVRGRPLSGRLGCGKRRLDDGMIT